MKPQYIVLMGILSFIFGGCEKPDFDKLVYESYNNSVAPEYREQTTIEVSTDKITYTTTLANETPNIKTTAINSEDFEKIKNKIYELSVIKCKSSDECDGGGIRTVTGYKKGKTVFSNTHYGCHDCPGFYELLTFLNNFGQ
jgi:hypothetical protein